VSLESIGRLLVSAEALEKTEESLRAAGREGYELFVLWSGVVDGQCFRVLTPHVPRQTSFRTESGLVVRVEGEALHRLNVWLYENREILAVQVHAHPTDAFHSDTDDAYPIVTALGGFSVVAADFARKGLLCEDTEIFRLTPVGWELSLDARELIKVV
jgi:hypothetical protein